MKYLRYACLLGLLFFLFDCQRPTSERAQTKLVLTEKETPSILLSDVFSLDSALIIESDLPFGELANVFFSDKGYILHYRNPDKLVKTDYSGNVISVRAAGEGISGGLGDITHSVHFEKHIYVLDREMMRLSKLNQDLQVVSGMSVPFYAQSFVMQSEDIAIFYTGNEVSDISTSKVLIYDIARQNLIAEYLPISSTLQGYFNFLTTTHLIHADSGVLFWDSSLRTVYAIKQNVMMPLYEFDFGQNGVADDFYENQRFKNSMEFILHMRRNNYTYRPFKVLANTEYFLTYFEHKGGIWASIQNVTSGHSVAFKEIKEDMITGQLLSETFTSCVVGLHGKDNIVVSIPPEYFRDEAKEGFSNGMILFGTLKM
jgi:hypothetical protein